MSHFISPVQPPSYTTHALLHYQAQLTGLFFRVGFANHVRQWNPWMALDGRYGSDIHPCVSETSLRPFRLVWAYDQHFLDSYMQLDLRKLSLGLLAQQQKSILWLNIKATLLYYPGTPSTWVQIAKSAFTEGFSQAFQTMKVHHRACGTTEWH